MCCARAWYKCLFLRSQLYVHHDGNLHGLEEMYTILMAIVEQAIANAISNLIAGRR